MYTSVRANHGPFRDGIKFKRVQQLSASSTLPSTMAKDSVFKGTDILLGEISRVGIQHNSKCSVVQENTYFSTSYDLGPTRIVVPGKRHNHKIPPHNLNQSTASPAHWTPPELPIAIPLDGPPTDPRTILPACPLDPLLRAVRITSPDFDLKALDLISDRRNLRALLDFVDGRSQGERIDAEIIGGTVLFFLGWSGRGYGHSSISYGINFEKRFTSALSEGTIQHNRVINYTLGGLKMMVKYQVDACIASEGSTISNTSNLTYSTTPTGLQVIKFGTLVPPETIIEIKTLRSGGRNSPIRPQTMAQLWFSKTPIVFAGYHDGTGHFSSVEEINVESAGLLGRWEMKHRASLQKVVKVIELVKAHLLSSPVKRQAIVLTKERLQFYSVVDSYELGLPTDLRANWA